MRTLFRPSFLVSSSLIFSVVTSPSGRTSPLGMREAEEAPANLAKDDKGTSTSGEALPDPAETPTQRSVSL